jgi:ABC-2 type transport system permease protein
MIRLTRSELLKLRTTWGPWIVLIVTILFTALGIVTAFLIQVGPQNHVEFLAPKTPLRLRRLVGSGFAGGGVWMAAIIGVLCVTTEYRHKVMTTTLLVTPRRVRLLSAKLAASAILGVLLGIASLLLVGALGLPLFASQGGSMSALFDQAPPVVPGLSAAFALLGLFGVGFGVLVKNQIGAVLAVLGISFIVEPIIDGIVPWIGKWLPSAAAQAVAGGLAPRDQAANLLSWWLGAVILVAWSLAPAVIGYFVTFRRDVT